MSRFPSPKWKQNNPLELTQPGRVTFKLLGITYLVGKIKFKLFFHGPKWLSKFNLLNLLTSLKQKKAVETPENRATPHQGK